MPGPYGPGQDYTLRDVAAGLMARGITDPQVLAQAVAIVARENGLHSPDQVGNTATLNTSEPPNVAAIGPFQFIYTGWSDGTNRAYGTYDRQQAANSLDYTLNYVVPLLQNKDFSPWTTPQLGMTSQQLAAQFASPSSPFFQTAQAAIASAGGATGPRPGSQPVSASIGGNVNDSVMGPNGRTFGQIRGTQYLSPDEATFYRNLAGIANPAPAPQQQAQQPLGPTVAPGQEYAPGALGDQQRFNYLTGLVQRGVTIGPDAQQFLNNYGNDQGQDFGGGRAGARIGITPPSTGDGGLQGQQQPAVPFYGTAQPSAGNQTTLDNATAQAQYDQNRANAQQAANQAYQASPAVAGALAAQQPAPAISGTPSQGDQANAQQGGAESQFQGFKSGGSAVVGKGKKKPSAPSLPVGAPFADWGVNNGDFNTTPVVPPVSMPINGVNPNFNDAMPVGRNLDTVGQPQMYADGGDALVGQGAPFDWAPTTPAPALPQEPQLSGPSGGLNGYGPGEDVGLENVPEQLWNGRAVALGWQLPGAVGGGTTNYNKSIPQNYDTNLANIMAADPSTPNSQAWIGSGAAPPLNEPIDTRIQATKAGLQGLGIDPRLADLAPMTLTSNDILNKMKAGGYYGDPDYQPNGPARVAGPDMVPPTSSVVMPQTEWNPRSAVDQEGSMHEFLHALESSMTPQDRQVLSSIQQTNPIPPAFNTWHPGGITGYFDAWEGTHGAFQIPQAVKDFINRKVAEIRGAPAPEQYANGGGMDVGSGSVRAPEPIMAIGVNTGKPYFEAGEAGLERISVTPIKKMEDGGTATAGLDPNDPRNQGFGSQPGSSSFVPPPPPIMGPAASNYTPPDYSQYGDPRAQQLADQQALLNSRLASIGPSQSYIDAQGRVIQSRSDNIPNQSAYLGAQGNVYNQQAANFPNQSNYLGALGGVYNAQQGTIGPQRNYIDAQGNVIGAQEQQTAGERGYIGQAQQANAQTLQEEQAQIAAAHNIPDLTAIGAAQSYQDSTDYLYRMGGVTPADVDTRGAPLPAGSPVNTRAKIQSQAEILKANNAEAQNVRNLQLQGAKLAVDLLGTNVDAAREAAARVGLTVDQAKLVVQQAQNQADIAQLAVRYGDLNTARAQNQADVAGLNVRYGDLNTSQFQNAADLAGLGVRQADLNTERLGYQNSLSELPPQAGLAVYTNPFTGESKYMTPAQARVQEQADSALIGGGGSALGTYGTGASNAGVAAAAGVPADDAGQTEAGGYAKQSESSLLAAYKAGRLGRYLTLSALITKYKAMGLDDAAVAARAQFNVNQIDAAKTGATSGSSSGGGGFVPQFSN